MVTKLPRPNFDEARERREQDGSELKVGAITRSLFAIPVGERRKYQPIGEIQGSSIADMVDCASRDKVNDAEAQLNYAYRNNLLTQETKDFFDSKGYTVWKDSVPYIECADAYIAIKSKTTKQGNSLKAPAQAVHEWGLVPKKLLPLESWMAWEDYHNPARITKEIEAIGLEFIKRLPITYQQVYNYQFEDEITKAEICTAGYGWPDPINGVYPKTNFAFNHAFKLMEPKYFAQDNYLDSFDGDYVKQLDPGYRFFDWGYQMAFTAQNSLKDTTKPSLLNETITWEAIRVTLNKILALIIENPELFKPSIETPPSVPKEQLLNTMCLAIQKHEGWILSPPSRSVRNHNPGNCRYSSVGYLPKYQPVKKDAQNFAIFKDYETGFMYLKNLVLEKARKSPEWNLYDFFKVYAPAEDNNDPKGYAEVVARAMSVSPLTWKVWNLL